jgi:hypothetical protein
MEWAFKPFRNRKSSIKKAADKFYQDYCAKKNMKNGKYLKEYYKAYYSLMKNNYLNSIPVLEAQVAFIRNMLIIVPIYIIILSCCGRNCNSLPVNPCCGAVLLFIIEICMIGLMCKIKVACIRRMLIIISKTISKTRGFDFAAVVTFIRSILIIIPIHIIVLLCCCCCCDRNCNSLPVNPCLWAVLLFIIEICMIGLMFNIQNKIYYLVWEGSQYLEDIEKLRVKSLRDTFSISNILNNNSNNFN